MEAVALGLPGLPPGCEELRHGADNHADEAAWLR